MKTRYRKLGWTVAMIILATLACSLGGGGVTQPPPTEPPTEAPVTEPPTQPPPMELPTQPPPAKPTTPPLPTPISGETATLTLYNDSGETVCYVYISPTDSTQWGQDWLGANEVVNDGASRVFDVPVGAYDLRADDCDGNALDIQWEVDVSGPVDWTIGGGAEGGMARLTLYNDSGETVCYVYISPTDSTEWGQDWLGASEVVGDGASRVFDVPVGAYDLRADDCDGNALDIQWDVDVSGPVDWTIGGGPGGGTATLILQNNSNQTICYVNISPSTSDSWGNDWLGSSETIAPGGTRSFSVPAGTYDVRALNCDNQPIDVEWEIELSGTVNWSVP